MTTTTSSTASSTSALVAQINASSSGSSSGTASSTKAMSDQFLKLLITQIQNQDPLNPTDNAQFTSQLAQINTVSGLEKVNESISSMSSQFLQMQAMQSASLVGRSVIVPGNALTVSDGKATGQFELSSAADSVKVDVLSSAGRVIDTIDIGVPVLSMHSPFEIVSKADVYMAYLTFKAFCEDAE
jgi:flagellar basal-body rod modification protein FlgD